MYTNAHSIRLYLVLLDEFGEVSLLSRVVASRHVLRHVLVMETWTVAIDLDMLHELFNVVTPSSRSIAVALMQA